MPARFSASIVLYNNDADLLAPAIESTLRTPGLETLYLVDNSDEPRLRSLAQTSNNVVYDFTGRNIGFGAGHNRAIERSRCAYHAIINPDVEFPPTVIPALIELIQNRPEIGLTGPALTSKPGVIEHWWSAPQFSTEQN